MKHDQARNDDIVRLRETGLMPRHIAKQMGLSRGAVIGVLYRAGKCTPGFRDCLRGEELRRAKLTADQVRAIRAAPKGALKPMAAQFGVSRRTVTDIRMRKTWTHLE